VIQPVGCLSGNQPTVASRRTLLSDHREYRRPFTGFTVVVDPSTINHGICKFFCGPESFTPARSPLLGRPLSCNEVDVNHSRVAYTQWVNEAGGLEGDLTVTRLEQEKFFAICGENAHDPKLNC
jgi:hypothetical protein